MFILDFSDEFFHDILESDDTRCFTMFVRHNSHLNMETLEIFQELLNFLVLWDEVSGSDESIEVNLCISTKCREEVFQIDDTDYFIDSPTVDGDA
jgi:hypothetical protein